MRPGPTLDDNLFTSMTTFSPMDVTFGKAAGPAFSFFFLSFSSFLFFFFFCEVLIGEDPRGLSPIAFFFFF